MNDSLVRPILRLRNKLFPHRILPYVGQLLLVLNAVTHPMMKRTSLPRPRLIQMPAAELAFPELNPLVNPELQILRRAQEMQVIRHQQIIADELRPRLFAPQFHQ